MKIRCYQWYAIPLEQKRKMIVSEGKIYPELGYHDTQQSIKYVKCYIGDHFNFQETCKVLPYDGNLSVRKDP